MFNIEIEKILSKTTKKADSKIIKQPDLYFGNLRRICCILQLKETKELT